MESGPDQRKGLSKVVAGVAIIVVIAALVGVLEAPISSVTCTTQGTEVLSTTAAVASTVTYSTSTPNTQPQTQSLRVFNINPTTIAPSAAAVTSSNLTAGAQVAIVWTTTSAVNAYLLTSSQHQAYSGTGAPSQSLGSTTNSSNGKLALSIPANDTYYLVIFNPSTQSASLYSASGVATFNGNVTTYVTVTTSSVTTVEQSTTVTTTTTSTYQHAKNLLASGGCPS